MCNTSSPYLILFLAGVIAFTTVTMVLSAKQLRRSKKAADKAEEAATEAADLAKSAGLLHTKLFSKKQELGEGEQP